MRSVAVSDLITDKADAGVASAGSTDSAAGVADTVTDTNDAVTRSLNRVIERVLLVICGLYQILMASLTLFVYASWLRGRGYTALNVVDTASNELSRDGLQIVDNAVSVSNIYAMVVLAVGIVSIIIAFRGVRSRTISRPVIAWLIVCMVCSLVTMDLIAVALYSLTCAVYCSRNKAIRAWMAAQR